VLKVLLEHKVHKVVGVIKVQVHKVMMGTWVQHFTRLVIILVLLVIRVILVI